MTMNIVLLCRSLNVGGTERQLITLAKGFYRRGIKVTVLVFYGGGTLENELRDCGVTVVDLGKRRRWDFVLFFLRAARAIRKLKPEIVYGFLAPANALASLLRLVLPRMRVV